ncbi:spermidine hydroxycinnamoyl transferase-like protein [Tanacetum coccineum]
MRVTANPSYMVKPAEPTWSGRLPLSELDHTGMTTHVPTIYFYKQSSQNWATVLQTLITSLSTTLVHFYPLAGRLVFIAGGRLELDCNTAGVQFTEAFADVKLVHLDDFLEYPIFDNLIPKVDYHNTQIEGTPLMETIVANLKLTETHVRKLRSKANEYRRTETERGFTRYEAVTAHAWQTSCKVRNLEPNQPTIIGICIDVRTRMNPPLPEKYFGNAIVDMMATGTSGEIVSETLGYVSSKIRDTIDKADDEYVNSMIDFLKNQPDLTKFQDLQSIKDGEGPFYGNPNLSVISWLTLPMYGVDFGWGKEYFTGPGTHDAEDGDFLILPGEEGGGSLVVAFVFTSKTHGRFQKNVL